MFDNSEEKCELPKVGTFQCAICGGLHGGLDQSEVEGVCQTCWQERTDATAFDRAIMNSKFDAILLARMKIRIADGSPKDLWETAVFNEAKKQFQRTYVLVRWRERTSTIPEHRLGDMWEVYPDAELVGYEPPRELRFVGRLRLVSSTIIPASRVRDYLPAEGCISCWRKTTDERVPCGKLNDARLCLDCAAAIAQGQDIKCMTYGKHRNREYEHRAKTWAASSPEDKATSIAGRCEWLDDQMRTRAEFSAEVKECRFCGAEPALHSWPTAFRCACGEAYVVDRWFPDNIERVYRMVANRMTAEDVKFLREIGIRP